MSDLIDVYAGDSVSWQQSNGVNKYSQATHAAPAVLRGRLEMGEVSFRNPQGDLVLSDGTFFVRADSGAGVGDLLTIGSKTWQVAGARKAQGLDDTAYIRLFLAVGKDSA